MRRPQIRIRWSPILPLLLLVAVSLALARPSRPPASASGATDGVRGLQFRLSEGAQSVEARLPGVRHAPTTTLSSDVANRLLPFTAVATQAMRCFPSTCRPFGQ